MSMTLQELNNKIHSISTPTELSTELASLKSDIKSAINAGGSFAENYFENHTGRELFRKLHNFELNSLIKDQHDSGFRPQKFNLDRTSHRNSVSNIIAWFDSEHVEMSGNKVSKLIDKSGNGFDLDSNSNNSTITNTQNGVPVISIPEGDSFKHSTARNFTNAAGNYLFYIVAKVITVDNVNDSIFSFDGTNSGSDFQIDSADATEFKFRMSVARLSGVGSGTTSKKYYSNAESVDLKNNFHIFGLILNKEESSATLSLDGLAADERSLEYTNNISDALKMRIFVNRGDNKYPVGEFAEFIMTEDLTMRDEIEFYLSNKWGLTSLLDATHPYKDLPYKSLNS